MDRETVNNILKMAKIKEHLDSDLEHINRTIRAQQRPIRSFHKELKRTKVTWFFIGYGFSIIGFLIGFLL